MLRIATWQVVAILALVAAAFLLVVPSFLPRRDGRARWSARLPSWLPARPIVLGLDLQGGAHLLMEVDKASLIKGQVEQLRDDVRAKLREGKIPISGGIGVQPRGVIVRIADAGRARQGARAAAERSTSASAARCRARPTASLDIADTGDGAIRLTLTDAAINDKVRRAVGQSIEVLNRRLNASGTKETNVQRQGADRVLIEVPGLQDTTQAQEARRHHRQARPSASSPTANDPPERGRDAEAAAGRRDPGARSG